MRWARSGDWIIRIDKVGGRYTIGGSVILVISKGFVDFNTGVLPRGWCERRGEAIRPAGR